MQLEELQRQWQRLDQKLDRALALEEELLRRVVMQPARRRVNRLGIWPAIDLALCVGVLLIGQAFLRGHWWDWRLVFPASVLMAGAGALLVDSIRQLRIVWEVDWTGPVTAIQGALGRLRVARVRQFKWVMLFSPLVGFCGLLVGAQWLFEGRVSVLDKLDPWWVAGNYAFGVLFVPAGYFLARVLARRGYRRWQGLLDDIAGNSLKAAATDLEQWASLQRNDSGAAQ